jgi:hypothetical protein
VGRESFGHGASLWRRRLPAEVTDSLKAGGLGRGYGAQSRRGLLLGIGPSFLRRRQCAAAWRDPYAALAFGAEGVFVAYGARLLLADTFQLKLRLYRWRGLGYFGRRTRGSDRLKVLRDRRAKRGFAWSET